MFIGYSDLAMQIWKNNFSLPHIDVLIEVQLAMPYSPLRIVSQATIKPKQLQKIKEIPVHHALWDLLL